MAKIDTGFTLMRPDGTSERRKVFLSAEPSWDELRHVLEPLIGVTEIEHVYVLHNGARADMFVDECSLLRKDRPPVRNDAATAIYRAATLNHSPATDPEELPWIAGVAVIFDRQVWF